MFTLFSLSTLFTVILCVSMLFMAEISAISTVSVPHLNRHLKQAHKVFSKIRVELMYD